MDHDGPADCSTNADKETGRGSESPVGVESPALKELKHSGRWSDIEAPAGFGEENFEDAFEGRTYTPPAPSPSSSPLRTPSPKTVSPVEAFDDPKYNAPVLWFKRIFGVDRETLVAAIMQSFEESDVKDVKIVSLYISTGESRDHAYLVLNSEPASKLLLDGTLSVIIKRNRGEEEEEEETSLWIDCAGSLPLTDEQDPYMLYIWQLPKDRPVDQVENELRRTVLDLCPIMEIDIPGDAKGLCLGWAQITFKYERDTQKCIYMLNYNRFMGTEIRAAFYQLNRPPRRPISAPAPRKAASDRQQTRKSPNHLSSSGYRPSDQARKPSRGDAPAKTGRQRSTPENTKVQGGRGKTGRASEERRGEKHSSSKKAETKAPAPGKGSSKSGGWEVVGREGRTK